MTRWEYMLASATVDDLEGRLNGFGAEGWELAHLKLHARHYELVFKRPALTRSTASPTPATQPRSTPPGSG